MMQKHKDYIQVITIVKRIGDVFSISCFYLFIIITIHMFISDMIKDSACECSLGIGRGTTQGLLCNPESLKF